MKLVPYAGAAALLVALSACGSTATTSTTSSPSRAPTSASTSSTAPQSSRAVAVTFERSGGKTGRSEVHRYTAGEAASSGADRARVRAVLQAASTPALRSMHLPPMPQNLCCDRFTYTLHIRYADGSSRIIRTADGLHQPPELRALLSAAS